METTLSDRPTKDEDRAPPKGLYCRACWCQWFKVHKTRPLSGGRIRRVRICQNPNCGKRLYTTEIDPGAPKQGHT